MVFLRLLAWHLENVAAMLQFANMVENEKCILFFFFFWFRFRAEAFVPTVVYWNWKCFGFRLQMLSVEHYLIRHFTPFLSSHPALLSPIILQSTIKHTFNLHNSITKGENRIKKNAAAASAQARHRYSNNNF